jgi:branched-chain amino acid transport system permease protein
MASRTDTQAGTDAGTVRTPEARRWMPGRGDRILERWVPAIGPVLLVSIVAAIVLALNNSSVTLWGTGMLINVVVVVGLYTFTGNSGIMSFGHVAFMAIGAYTAGILTVPESTKTILMQGMPAFLRHAQFGTLPSILIGAGLATFVALLLCLPLMQMSGLRAAMATFAILQIVFVVAGNWNAVTLGTQGLIGVPSTTTVPVALVWAVIAIVVAHFYQSSSPGLRLKASREDESAAAASGIHIGNERRFAFVLSAFLVGAGGAIYGHWIGTFSPNDFYIPLTFLLFAMLVVGGMTSLAGATVGVLLISLIQEGAVHIEESTHATGLTEIVLALTMLFILVLRPAGILAGHELEWRFVKWSAWPWLVRHVMRRGGEPSTPSGNGKAAAEDAAADPAADPAMPQDAVERSAS